MSFHFDLGMLQVQESWILLDGNYKCNKTLCMEGLYSTDQGFIYYLLTVSLSIWAGRAHYGGGAAPEIGPQLTFTAG